MNDRISSRLNASPTLSEGKIDYRLNGSLQRGSLFLPSGGQYALLDTNFSERGAMI
jgi:hypothetical protein